MIGNSLIDDFIKDNHDKYKLEHGVSKSQLEDIITSPFSFVKHVISKSKNYPIIHLYKLGKFKVSKSGINRELKGLDSDLLKNKISIEDYEEQIEILKQLINERFKKIKSNDK